MCSAVVTVNLTLGLRMRPQGDGEGRTYSKTQKPAWMRRFGRDWSINTALSGKPINEASSLCC